MKAAAFDSRLKPRNCLTFSLVIQLNYIADIFELGQLVDLYAATRNTGRYSFYFKTKQIKGLGVPFLFKACVYLLSPQEAALFIAGEMATLLRVSLWL